MDMHLCMWCSRALPHYIVVAALLHRWTPTRPVQSLADMYPPYLSTDYMSA